MDYLRNRLAGRECGTENLSTTPRMHNKKPRPLGGLDALRAEKAMPDGLSRSVSRLRNEKGEQENEKRANSKQLGFMV